MKKDLDAYDRPQFEQSLPHHTIRDSGYESHLLWRLERGKKEGGGHLKTQLALQRSDDRKRQQTQQGHTPMADRCDDEGNGGFLITLAPFPENNNSATTNFFPLPHASTRTTFYDSPSWTAIDIHPDFYSFLRFSKSCIIRSATHHARGLHRSMLFKKEMNGRRLLKWDFSVRVTLFKKKRPHNERAMI